MTEAAESAATRPAPAPPFLSLLASAEWLCVSIATLKRLVAEGVLITVRVGARRKIPASHLEAYVAKNILLPDQVLSSHTLEQAEGFQNIK
jgi:excisionase family DNA binding protein